MGNKAIYIQKKFDQELNAYLELPTEQLDRSSEPVKEMLATLVSHVKSFQGLEKVLHSRLQEIFLT